ncbi:diacylglycerol kinase [Pelistega sp. NLN82]|uniref:Diacylglycerol kinase n=1 Tax=Pelistega ratti TaxID=2652177 RepID=A0A6L9Y303_9BURK|nr:diacylglycerol kinase [Pelistega ratti]NEN74720.1 diacylglycerol kinase [Pelistega ratti]
MQSNSPQPSYKSKRGLKRIKNALIYSLSGLKIAYRFEAAFFTELWLCLVLVPFAFILGQTGFEVLFLIATLFLVLIAELLNSAVEAIADRISHDYDEYIKRAKDMGSAAVFLCLSLVAITWGYFLIKRFFL